MLCEFLFWSKPHRGKGHVNSRKTRSFKTNGSFTLTTCVNLAKSPALEETLCRERTTPACFLPRPAAARVLFLRTSSQRRKQESHVVRAEAPASRSRSPGPGCQQHARALILSHCSAAEPVMPLPTPRDTGDEILKGWLFMAWLLMERTDVISWAPSEENSFSGWFKAL